MFEISLLGPAAIFRDGVALPLPQRKAMTLVAYLAVERSVRRDELAERMWPGLPASSARRNLRRELARLRDAGLRDAIAGDDEHVVLGEQVRIDVDAFLRDAAEGRSDAALVRWRGPFASDLAAAGDAGFADWVELQRARLVGPRGKALEAAADAAEAAGDRRGAIAPLQSALADDPLQERLHRRLMRVHAGLGEREQALAQYERCRRLLYDELGIAPLEETEALARELREQGRRDGGEVPGAARDEPPRRVAPPAPAAAPDLLPAQLPFVGRADEIAELEAGWRRGGALVVMGPGGIGKSRLAADFVAARAPSLVVACRAGDDGVAYRSASRLLRALVAAGGAPAEAWVTSELARLLPEIGPAPPPLADQMQSLRFLDAMAHAVTTLAADNFGAVLVDDLHLADAASAALIGHVIERLRDEAAEGREVPRVVVTLREGEGAAAIDEGVAQLAAGGSATRVAIAPLGPDDVLELVRRLSGADAPSRFAARLHGATGGNAFFVHETLRHLVATGWLSRGESGVWQTPLDERTEDYAELPLPESVFKATAARVDRGGEAMRRTLEAASLAGEPFEIETLAGATALSPLEIAAALEQAEAMQLVAAAGGGMRFAHDLVRQSLAARLSLERRRLLHGRLAIAAERCEAEPATIGDHWAAAGKPARAVSWWLRAAERAAVRWADVDAIALYRRVLDAGAEDTDALKAERALTKLHMRRVEPEAALAVAQAAVERAQRLPDADAAALAIAALADLENLVHRSEDGLRRLDELAARPGLEPATRARIQLLRCDAWRQQGRHGEARAAAREVLALLDGGTTEGEALSGDAAVADALRRDALISLGTLSLMASDMGEGVGHAHALREVCARLGDTAGIGTAERLLGVILLNLGTDRRQARFHLEAARRISAGAHDIPAERVTVLNLIKLAADEGDADEVLRLAEAGWNLSPRFPQTLVRLAFQFAFLYAHSLHGELGLALDLAATIRDETRGDTEFESVSQVADQLSDVYLAVGDAATTLAMLDGVPPAPGAGSYLRLRLALVRSGAHLVAGELDAVHGLLDGWDERSDHHAIDARILLSLQRADLACREGRLDDATRELDKVEAFSNRELAMSGAGLRLRLAAATGGAATPGAPAAVEAAIVRARKLLAEGRAPVSYVLDLRLALVGALQAAGRVEEAAAERASVQAELSRLAATLGRHADRRDAFFGRYPLP